MGRKELPQLLAPSSEIASNLTPSNSLEPLPSEKALGKRSIHSVASTSVTVETSPELSDTENSDEVVATTLVLTPLQQKPKSLFASFQALGSSVIASVASVVKGAIASVAVPSAAESSSGPAPTRVFNSKSLQNCAALDDDDKDGEDPDAGEDNPDEDVDDEEDAADGSEPLQKKLRTRPSFRYSGPCVDYVHQTTLKVRKANHFLLAKIRSKDLWIHPENGPHAIKEQVKKGNIPDPSLMFRLSIFIWAPHESFPDVTLLCPSCRYHCKVKACNHTYLGSDKAILQLLPQEAQDLFPALLSHRSGLDLELVRHIRSSIAHGTGPTKVHHIIRENYTYSHGKQELAYLSTICSIQQSQLAQSA
ncbi:hypothetical protein BDR26DRAFT_919259 [Obelidium mucronatum]|nr:hypothetical protein BDR26DRAFT_919259 [Obelidium mucronatum]